MYAVAARMRPAHAPYSIGRLCRASVIARANSGTVHAVVRSKCPLRCAAMYGEQPKMIPATIDANRSRVRRHASR
jgi:hypothetical protein